MGAFPYSQLPTAHCPLSTAHYPLPTPMGIVLVGTSHKTAPVEVRERLAFAEARLADALRELVDRKMIIEGLIVSTCNRVELIAATPNGAGVPEDAVSRLYD